MFANVSWGPALHTCSAHGGEANIPPLSTRRDTAAGVWRLYGLEDSPHCNSDHHHKAASQLTQFESVPPNSANIYHLCQRGDISIENGDQLVLPVFAPWETPFSTFIKNWLPGHKATITEAEVLQHFRPLVAYCVARRLPVTQAFG